MCPKHATLLKKTLINQRLSYLDAVLSIGALGVVAEVGILNVLVKNTHQLGLNMLLLI